MHQDTRDTLSRMNTTVNLTDEQYKTLGRHLHSRFRQDLQAIIDTGAHSPCLSRDVIETCWSDLFGETACETVRLAAGTLTDDMPVDTVNSGVEATSV